MGDGGEVGCGPLVEIGNELEGELRQLVTDGGEDERAGGRQTERGSVEGTEDTTSRG